MVNSPISSRLTRRELAKICEVTPSAVSQAEARGALLADEDGKIDVRSIRNVLWIQDHPTSAVLAILKGAAR